MLSFFYDLLYGLAALVGWPWLIWRRIRRGPGSLALGERFGHVPPRPVSAHCIWIHGVSLGEINATRTLVSTIHRRSPATTVVVSSTTRTGLDRAREMFPRLVVFRFPLDFSWMIRRTLRAVRPSVIVLMELEVWPNLIEVATRAGIPVVIANGRITSERSMRNFQRPVLRSVAGRMFRQLRWVGAQDEAYAERFRALGVPGDRVEVSGSLKYDSAEVSDFIEGQDKLAAELTLDPRRPIWVCGSTGPGEEAILLDAYSRLVQRHAGLQLVLVPRKPERFAEVSDLVVARGFACLHRSGKPPRVPPTVAEPVAVFLGDTMGELRKFYSLASIVFVGRTLVPMGGSDLMEVAALAKPILVGPHTENFAEAAALLQSAGAVRVVGDAGALEAGVDELLRDAEIRRRMGDAGRAAVVSRQGATERTVDVLFRAAKISD